MSVDPLSALILPEDVPALRIDHDGSMIGVLSMSEG